MKSPEVSIPNSRRRWLRAVTWLLVFGLIPFGLLIGCQSRLLYFPRAYEAGTVGKWQKEYTGKTLDYTTSQGKQRAFLQGSLKSPRNLWIFCAGNGTLALEWSDWLAVNAPREDAFLLVDFPGYGDCVGSPTPGKIRENLKAALPLAVREIGWPATPDPARLRFCGHSLGAAAVMMAATEFHIQRGVLVSPFTSTMDMAEYVTHLPLGWAVWHRFDNSARLAELSKRGMGQVIILHGTADGAIPIRMSRQLQAAQPKRVILQELQGGDHNSLPDTHRAELASAMKEIGRAQSPQ